MKSFANGASSIAETLPELIEEVDLTEQEAAELIPSGNSLTGEGATKGVFVTTSDFSADARDYVTKVQHRIVLINGERLARLMIRHEVGVRARRTLVIRSVDEDYFSTT